MRYDELERLVKEGITQREEEGCNGATTRSILGVMIGAKKLPEKWIEPLNNHVESYVVGCNNSQTSDLAQKTFNLALRVLKGEAK